MAFRSGREGLRRRGSRPCRRKRSGDRRSPRWQGYWAGFNARLLVDRGDLAGARAALGRANRTAPGSDGDLLLRRAEVEVLLGEAAWERALEAAVRLDGARRRVMNPAWVPVFGLQARALAWLVRYDEAEAAASAGWSRPEMGRVEHHRVRAPGTRRRARLRRVRLLFAGGRRRAAAPAGGDW
jgi:hypothetical protein